MDKYVWEDRIDVKMEFNNRGYRIGDLDIVEFAKLLDEMSGCTFEDVFNRVLREHPDWAVNMREEERHRKIRKVLTSVRDALIMPTIIAAIVGTSAFMTWVTSFYNLNATVIDTNGSQVVCRTSNVRWYFYDDSHTYEVGQVVKLGIHSNCTEDDVADDVIYTVNGTFVEKHNSFMGYRN